MPKLDFTRSDADEWTAHRNGLRYELRDRPGNLYKSRVVNYIDRRVVAVRPACSLETALEFLLTQAKAMEARP